MRPRARLTRIDGMTSLPETWRTTVTLTAAEATEEQDKSVVDLQNPERTLQARGLHRTMCLDSSR